MLWEKFKDQFHESWHNKIRPFVESKECDEIYAFLKERSKLGHKIAPISSITYKAFLLTPLNDIKVVLLSYCPYHSFYNGIAVADGLAFSCSITGKLQPSLEKFYEGVENDLFGGLNLNYTKSSDLSYLANQGVLLMNAALTVEKDKAGSHQDIWEPFTKYILEECLAYTGIPIVFIGKDAQKYEKYVTPLTHGFTFNVDHPAFAARNREPWDTKGVFKSVQSIIEQNGKEKIDWLDEKCPF